MSSKGRTEPQNLAVSSRSACGSFRLISAGSVSAAFDRCEDNRSVRDFDIPD